MNFKSIKRIIGVVSSAVLMCFIFAGCTPTATGTSDAAGGSTTSSLMTFLPIVLIFAAMYFFMIRPENKKKKKVEEMRSSLGVGDKIVTIGGVVGEIVSVNGDKITIETGEDRVRIQFAKWAISTKDK